MILKKMQGKFFFAAFLFVLLFQLSFVSSAHYVIGRVNNALDLTLANDHTVVLWNPSIGLTDNLTDIIGPNGNSGQDNLYMIDCELLNNPCNIDETISLKVINGGDNYASLVINITVTGAGFDLADNLTLNSPPNITSVLVDDDLLIPENEIDLLAGNVRDVLCKIYVDELDYDSLQSASGIFYLSDYSFSDPDDNNSHYTNNSCYINESYGGEGESEITCGFFVEYYSDPGAWQCLVSISDNMSLMKNSTDETNVNELLAIGLENRLDFGKIDALKVSDEGILNVTNYGNVKVNLSLSGYGLVEEDGYAMSCEMGTIEINSLKYNLTDSILGDLTLGQFEGNYTNLTNNSVVKEFNLDYRTNDEINDRINTTYWRIYVPTGVAGTCNGTIVFGAIKAVAT